jgi:hypothetical protein
MLDLIADAVTSPDALVSLPRYALPVILACDTVMVGIAMVISRRKPFYERRPQREYDKPINHEESR